MENEELKENYIDERTGIEYKLKIIICQILYYLNQEEQEI